MERIKKYLVEQCQLGAEFSDLIVSQYRAKTLKKNEFFIREGGLNNHTAFILDGVIRYFTFDNDGNDPTCYFSYPLHFVSDPYSYFDRLPATLSAQAVSKCELAVLTRDGFRRIQNEFPGWEELCRKIIMGIGLEFANQKTLLSLSANERYDFFLKNYPEVAKQAPLQFIASYLGIAQPSLSRIRKRASVVKRNK